MFNRLVFSFLFILSTTMIHASAYSDYDVDGVEDSVDECPNTPFDIIVDERGCEEGKTYKGEFALLVGSITGIDSETENLTNILFFMNYRYRAWDVSLSTFNDIRNTISNVPNTVYISTGYHIDISDKWQSKIALGTKQSTLQNDYYMNLNFDYQVNRSQNIFLFYSYTITEDSSTENYNNFHTFSLGTGRVLTDYWYSAVSYDFAGANLSRVNDYKALSWSNTFALSSKYYILSTYSYGLSTAASNHTVSLQFGVKFE